MDALCTKCELVLAHTVIAMVGPAPVKVECNTCHGVHRFRGQAVARDGANPTRAKAARPLRAAKVTIPFEDVLANKKTAAATTYSPKHSYKADDVVDHPLFGRGFVSAVRDAAKIEVTFRSDVKVLVHGRS